MLRGLKGQEQGSRAPNGSAFFLLAQEILVDNQDRSAIQNADNEEKRGGEDDRTTDGKS